MSIEQALVIALISVSIISAVLLYMVVRLSNQLLWTWEDLQDATDVDHIKCMAAVMKFVGDEWAAQVLEVAADDYESPQGHADIDRISRLIYKADGPPVPSIWLRERADKLRILIDRESITDKASA